MIIPPYCPLMSHRRHVAPNVTFNKCYATCGQFAAATLAFLRGGICGPFDPELVIYRLKGRSRSCVAASADGRREDANVRARALAGTFVRTFRCCKDKRRMRE